LRLQVARSSIVGSMAIPRKSKARERFEDGNEKKPNARQMEPDPEVPSIRAS